MFIDGTLLKILTEISATCSFKDRNLKILQGDRDWDFIQVLQKIVVVPMIPPKILQWIPSIILYGFPENPFEQLRILSEISPRYTQQILPRIPSKIF